MHNTLNYMYYAKKDSRFNNTQSIQDILSKIVDSPNLSKGIREARAVQSWGIVLGASIARITTNVNMRGGVMYVSLNSSVIRSELLMHKDKIIESINKEVGAKVVYDLVIR
jgi:predicted nucleic acid-binding Zn ribbon protein